MSLLSTKRRKVSDLVIDEIKRMVREGLLRKGDKLPNQNKFAAQLGVSRPSLREALAQLTRAGIIDQGPGVGTILRTEHPDLWPAQPTPPPLTDERAMIELIDARSHIETLMVEQAVRHMTKMELRALERSVKRMHVALTKKDRRAYLREDVAFHYQIANGSHNRYVIHMFVTIRSLMEQFIEEMFSHFPELIDNSFGHHEAILAAIQARDRDRAIAEIQTHMDDIRRRLLRSH